MVALKRAVLAFSGVGILHGVVVPYPVQDVPKDAVQEDTTPQELLQVRLEQGVTSTMHSMELSLDMCPGTLYHISMHSRVIGIDKVQPVVDNVVWLWQLIVSFPAICDNACTGKNMLGNDWK